MSRVFLSPPHVFGDERALVADAFDSNWIAPLGPHVDGFEAEFSVAVGVPHATALSSGTAGLHLALRVIGAQHTSASLSGTGSRVCMLPLLRTHRHLSIIDIH